MRLSRIHHQAARHFPCHSNPVVSTSVVAEQLSSDASLDVAEDAMGSKHARLLSGLNDAQVAAVTAPIGRVVVLAGAGSGKTRVLSRRIAWRIVTGQVDPNRVLTVTFTRKAAAELRSRQRSLNVRDQVPAGTFHSLALGQLRQRWTERGTIAPTVLSNKIGFLARLLPSSSNRNAAELAAEIDWARARLIEPAEYGKQAERSGRRPSLGSDDLAELMVRYQKEKRRRRMVDYDDLLTLAIRDIEDDPAYAAALRWRHRHFFVDEFQDVNPLQHKLLLTWLGDRDDVFIVGDPNQAIYSWNGAEPSLLQDLADDAANTVIRLGENYRSTPEILRVSGAVLGRDPKLSANRPNGPNPTITVYPNDEAEAEGIAQRLRHCHSVQDPWSDQAVLVRTNAQLVLIEQALKSWHIPCEVRSGPGPLGSPQVKDALKRLGQHGVDLVSALEQLDEELNVDLTALSSTAAERHTNLLALSRIIHEYISVDQRPNGPGLVAWLATINKGDAHSDGDAVSLATFHSAKGLEWPVVHVAGMEDGFCPIAYAETDDQLAEEQRLIYVALTRAEQELHLTWAKKRTFANNTMERDASPFLAAIDQRIKGLGPSQQAEVDWQAHIAHSRRRLNPTGQPAASPQTPVQKDTLAELRSWRSRKARAARVPVHVIATDQVLQTIAENRPSTEAQLATISGMRPSKLTRFGPEILAILAR